MLYFDYSLTHFMVASPLSGFLYIEFRIYFVSLIIITRNPYPPNLYPLAPYPP
jgi:hypothetical protein